MLRKDLQFLVQPTIAHKYKYRKHSWGNTVHLVTANLRYEYQLDVGILYREGAQFHGLVIAAAPIVDIPVNKWEVQPGQEVVFQLENIAKVE